MLLTRRAPVARAAAADRKQLAGIGGIVSHHAHAHRQQQQQQQQRQQRRPLQLRVHASGAADTAQQQQQLQQSEQQQQPPPADPQAAPSDAITLTERALAHLIKLRQERAPAAGGEPAQLIFRVGVKQGGCSGLSYVMDWEDASNIKADDYVVEAGGGAFKLAVDPKSLLYIFGMQLDYSDALIGGGFNMINPNATDSCGCGKSFGV